MGAVTVAPNEAEITLMKLERLRRQINIETRRFVLQVVCSRSSWRSASAWLSADTGRVTNKPEKAPAVRYGGWLGPVLRPVRASLATWPPAAVDGPEGRTQSLSHARR